MEVPITNLILKGYIHKSVIELDDILKVTICSLGKGELKDYEYYSFHIKGGRLKDLTSDLQQVGIDASYIYRNGVAE